MLHGWQTGRPFIRVSATSITAMARPGSGSARTLAP